MKLDTKNTPLRYFIYCRKSTESEDRQIASIPDQLRVLSELATREGLTIVGKPYAESGSAHVLGRPKFNEMLSRIQKGDANGILVWHQNRLARNPMDGSTIIYLFDQGFIKQIKTPNTTFENNADNKATLGHGFVDSKKYSDELSEVVRRGLYSKVNERHEWPGVAKPGYSNVMDPIYRTSKIEVDKERFPLLQKAFDMIRTGVYTPLQALDYLNNDLGYRTRRTRKKGNLPMPKATWYRILTDPFYYGLIIHTQGTVMGTHEPMMTKSQFDELQMRLCRFGKVRRSNLEFPYKEVLRCGECGGVITAQDKLQVRCKTCKTKYHKKKSDNLERCVACKRKFTSPDDYQILHYVYYGCTKKKTPGCSQGHVRLEEIEQTIDQELAKFEIRPEFRDWAIKYLNEVSKNETDTHKVALTNLHKQYSEMDTKINSLVNLYIAPINADKSVMSDEEFKAKKTELVTEKASLMDRLNKADEEKNRWIELTEKTFDFACYARYWFAKGDAKAKTEILHTLGENLTLKDGKLWINRANQFFIIEKGKREVEEIVSKLEPEKLIDLKDNLLSLKSVSNTWRRRWDSNPQVPYGTAV